MAEPLFDQALCAHARVEAARVNGRLIQPRAAQHREVMWEEARGSGMVRTGGVDVTAGRVEAHGAKSGQFYRFLGIPSRVDVAAACCLLIIEHPQFTSSSLQHAQLLNVQGHVRATLLDLNEKHAKRSGRSSSRWGINGRSSPRRPP